MSASSTTSPTRDDAFTIDRASALASRVRRKRVQGRQAAASLLALGTVLASCAGAGRICGHGRPARGSATMERGGPYCISIEAEGVGNVSLEINRMSPPARESGEEDASEGRVARAPSGPMQYTMSAAPAGVTWVDVCSLPSARHTLVNVDDNDVQVPEMGAPSIPFPIRVWDQVATPPFTVSSNGWMSFMSVTYGPITGTLPSRATPNNTVAPFWTDLHTRSTGICYATVGSAPRRRFVIQWQDLHFCCTDDPSVHLSFEVIINEARRPEQNNVIDVIYNQMDGWQQRPGAAGFENPTGSFALPIPPPFTAPRALRFMPSH